jgi:hypothetical protein
VKELPPFKPPLGLSVNPQRLSHRFLSSSIRTGGSRLVVPNLHLVLFAEDTALDQTGLRRLKTAGDLTGGLRWRVNFLGSNNSLER